MLSLLNLSPEKLKVLDRRKVSDEETWAHLAIEENVIFVRGLKSIAAFKWN